MDAHRLLTATVQGPEAVHRSALNEALGRDEDAVDPLYRFLNPRFRKTLWEYPESRVEPMIPGHPHAKQKEFLHDDSRHRFLFWGNQVGKTSIGAIDTDLLALGRHPSQRWEPPVTIWASGLSWEMWENYLLPEILTWLPPERVLDAPPPKQKSTKRTVKVRADNGAESLIIGKSAEQGREIYQSARVHRVWFDEEHPEAIWNEVQPRLVRFGGTTITTMTPLKGLTWVYHGIYEPWKRGERDDVYCSHAGLADNPSIQEEEIEALRRELEGNPSLLKARLYGEFTRPTGLALNYDPNRHQQSWDDDSIRHAIRERNHKVYGGIDFGSWRFAFVMALINQSGQVHVVKEYFSQREGGRVIPLAKRARNIHDVLDGYGAPKGRTRIYGDSANQTAITEINRALRQMGSPYTVVPVAKENKIRRTSVTRLNNLLHKGSLTFRRELGEGAQWRLGQDASSDGKPVTGSRLKWEINNWRYPEPRERLGVQQAQKQDPDDNTADGADAVAALRYLVMSWWTAARKPEREQKDNRNRDTGFERAMERHEELRRRGLL